MVIERVIEGLRQSMGWALVRCLPGMFACSAAIAAPATLPGGATPGGIAPTKRLHQQDFNDQAAVLPEIPRLIERPLAVDEGPVIAVRAIVVDGFTPMPKRGITEQALHALIEAAQASHPEGFTMGQLQTLADQITNLYRGKGLIVAQAFVPEQQVENGEVHLRIMAGTLGRVVVEDAKRYPEQLARHPFLRLIGKPIYNQEVESALLYTNDLPGLTTFGVFQPGLKEGESDLVLKATEKTYDVSVSADNYGTKFTGEERLLTSVTFNNPTRGGDALNITYQQSYEPKLSNYEAFDYRRPVFTRWRPGQTMGFSFSRNNFEVGDELKDLRIEGVTEIFDLYYRYAFLRNRGRNATAVLDFARKRSTVDTAKQPFSEDKLAILSAGLEFDFIDLLMGGGINQGSVTWSHGFKDFMASTQKNDNPGSSRRDKDGNPKQLGFNKFSFQFSRLQSLTRNQALIISLAGQHSEDLLVSLEQMAIGGPYSVRAYPQAEFLVDSGYVASLEWVVNAPGFAAKPAFGNRTWGQVLQMSAYVDRGQGWLHDVPKAQNQSVMLADAGIGVQMFLPAELFAVLANKAGKRFGKSWNLHFPGEFKIRFDLATPLGKRDASNNENPQGFISITYSN